MKIKVHFRLFLLHIQKFEGSNSDMKMGYPNKFVASLFISGECLDSAMTALPSVCFLARY